MSRKYLRLLPLLIVILIAPFLLIAGQLQAQNTTVPLCADVGGKTNNVVRAEIPTDAISSGGIFCRILAENRNVINAAQIGNQSVLDLGVINAVELFGLNSEGGWVQQFGNTVKVCLQGTGDIIYMDATQFPRLPTRVAVTSENDYTCTTINNGGTVVLVNGSGAAAPAVPAATVDPNATPLPPGVVPTATTVPAAGAGLIGCRVTTTYAVRLRTAPNTESDIIARLPYNMRLTATAHEGDWFQVIYLDGQGWVNSAYVKTAGACD